MEAKHLSAGHSPTPLAIVFVIVIILLLLEPHRGAFRATPHHSTVKRFSILSKRPVMTTLVMGAVLLFGIMGYRRLPVSDLPNVDFPTILVSASLPGATPDTMASAVALPLGEAAVLLL
jgi:hypothetical protein